METSLLQSQNQSQSPRQRNPIEVKLVAGRILHMGIHHGGTKALKHEEMLPGLGLSGADPQVWNRKAILGELVKAGVKARKYSIQCPAGLADEQYVELGRQLSQSLIDRGNGFTEFAVFGPGESRRTRNTRLCVITTEWRITPEGVTLPEHRFGEGDLEQEELQAVSDRWQELTEKFLPVESGETRENSETTEAGEASRDSL